MKLAIVVAAALAAAGPLAQAQTAQSLGAPAGNVERGKKVYMQQLCYTCHGTIGQGGDRGSGPKIYPNPYPFAAFMNQVRKPRQTMPPYSDALVSDQDLADLYHYLFSTKPSPAAKDLPLLRDF